MPYFQIFTQYNCHSGILVETISYTVAFRELGGGGAGQQGGSKYIYILI